MKYKEMTEEEFNNLSNYNSKKGIFNTGGSNKLYDEDGKTYFVKVFDIPEGPLYENELKTLYSLMKYKDIINIPELIMPEYIIKVNDKILGYMMPFIKSNNLSTILKDNNISNEEKINYLKQVGIILEKMKNIRDNTSLKDFYLNDLHEDNFIVDTLSKKIMVVDLVASKIDGNLPSVSKYLNPYATIASVSKYKKTDDNFWGGYIIPSLDSDIYSYIVMILNFVFKENINALRIDEYNKYLDYLLENGVNRELVDNFRLVISDKSNVNPYNLLDMLIPYIDKFKDKNISR